MLVLMIRAQFKARRSPLSYEVMIPDKATPVAEGLRSSGSVQHILMLFRGLCCSLSFGECGPTSPTSHMTERDMTGTSSVRNMEIPAWSTTLVKNSYKIHSGYWKANVVSY